MEEEGDLFLFAHKVDTINARICTETIIMFQHILFFSQGMVKALYKDQMITSLDILQELDHSTMKGVYCATKKPCGSLYGHGIFELSMTQIKLFAFWARRMW